MSGNAIVGRFGDLIVALVLLCAASVASPGQNFALVSRTALAVSSRAAIGAAFGIAAGATVYMCLAMFGASAAIGRMPGSHEAVRAVGRRRSAPNYLGTEDLRNLSKGAAVLRSMTASVTLPYGTLTGPVERPRVLFVEFQIKGTQVLLQLRGGARGDQGYRARRRRHHPGENQLVCRGARLPCYPPERLQPGVGVGSRVRLRHGPILPSVGSLQER